MNLTHNQHLDKDGNLHVLLSKTMSTTDIVMTRSVPAADIGATITRNDTVAGPAVTLGELSSTEFVRVYIIYSNNPTITSTLTILYLKW